MAVLRFEDDFLEFTILGDACQAFFSIGELIIREKFERLDRNDDMACEY